MTIEFPLRTVSEANQSEHWMARYRRKKAQQREVNAEWKAKFKNRKIQLPCVVTLTRIGPKLLDTDNLAGSWKWVQDEIARLIGVDDGNTNLLRFEYQQEATGKRKYAVRIEVMGAVK